MQLLIAVLILSLFNAWISMRQFFRFDRKTSKVTPIGKTSHIYAYIKGESSNILYDIENIKEHLVIIYRFGFEKSQQVILVGTDKPIYHEKFQALESTTLGDLFESESTNDLSTTSGIIYYVKKTKIISRKYIGSKGISKDDPNEKTIDDLFQS